MSIQVIPAGGICGNRMIGRPCMLESPRRHVQVRVCVDRAVEGCTPEEASRALDLQKGNRPVEETKWDYIQQGDIVCQSCDMPCRGYRNFERAVELGVVEEKTEEDFVRHKSEIMDIAKRAAKLVPGLTKEEALERGRYSHDIEEHEAEEETEDYDLFSFASPSSGSMSYEDDDDDDEEDDDDDPWKSFLNP